MSELSPGVLLARGTHPSVFACVSAVAKVPSFAATVRDSRGCAVKRSTSQGDCWARSPESTHHMMSLKSGRVVRRTLRDADGFGSHAFLWPNPGREGR